MAMGRADVATADKIIAVIKWLLVAWLLVVAILALVVPRLLKPVLVEALSTEQYRASLNSLSLNPVSMEVTARGFSLHGPDENPLLEFGRLQVGLQSSSLWFWALTLSDFQLSDAQVSLEIDEQGELNWVQWLDQLSTGDDTPSESVEEAAGLPRIIVNRFDLDRVRLRFTDKSRSKPFSTDFGPVSLIIHDLNTLPVQGAPYSIIASTETGERVEWRGDLSLQPLSSSGHLTMSGFQLTQIAEYASEWIGFDVADGRINLSGEYRWDGNLVVDKGRLSIRDVELQTRDAQQPMLGFSKLNLGGISADLNNKQVQANAIRLSRLWVNETLDEGGNSFLLASFLPATAEGSVAAEEFTTAEAPVAHDPQVDTREQAGEQVKVPDEPADESLPLSDWDIQVNTVMVNDARLHLTHNTAGQAVPLNIEPLNLILAGIRYPAMQISMYRLDAVVASGGQLEAEGVLSLLPFNTASRINVDRLDLRLLTPYVRQFVNTEMQSGLLNVQAELSVTEEEGGLATAANGNVVLADFNVRDLIRREQLLSFGSIEVGPINWLGTSGKYTLGIEQVAVNKPYARVIVFPDASTNLSQLVVERPQPEQAQGERAQEEQAQTEPETSESSFTLDVAQVGIAEGTAHFTDQSLPRATFDASIFDIRGSISGVSSRPESQAAVKIVGAVDTHSPVSLGGTVAPLAEQLALDLALQFNNIDLTRLNPYSDTYAGYDIEKGKLNAAFNYQLADSQLQGNNAVFIDQLTLGDRTDSSLATSLPVALAVALLRDKDGVIDLQLPVSGDVDDPEFEFGGLVGKAFVNVITKIVTSPFALLANLAGGEDNLDTVLFDAGSFQLNQEEQQKLNRLVSALDQRPGLRLSIEGEAYADQDGPALQQASLARELEAQGVRFPLDEAGWQIAYGIYESGGAESVKKQRKALLAENGGDENKAEEQIQAQVWQALLATQEVAGQDYETLARARADQVLEALLARGINPDRIFLQQPNVLASSESGSPRCQLSLDAK